MIEYNNIEKKLKLTGYTDYSKCAININDAVYEVSFSSGKAEITNIEIASGTNLLVTLYKDIEETIIYE